MDFIILGTLFLFFSCLGLYSLRRNKQLEEEKRFEEVNPILGQPLISTEASINLDKNDTMSYEPVTASVVVEQSLSKVLKNRWAHFFKKDKYYNKEFKKASKMAVIKMKNAAKDAHIIVNTRVQTSVIKTKNILESDKIYAVAYGTAVTYY